MTGRWRACHATLAWWSLPWPPILAASSPSPMARPTTVRIDGYLTTNAWVARRRTTIILQVVALTTRATKPRPHTRVVHASSRSSHVSPFGHVGFRHRTRGQRRLRLGATPLLGPAWLSLQLPALPLFRLRAAALATVALWHSNGCGHAPSVGRVDGSRGA
jgi:hypothetical protein